MDIAIQDNINIAHLLGEITALRDHDTALHSIEVTYLSSILGDALRLMKRSRR